MLPSDLWTSSGDNQNQSSTYRFDVDLLRGDPSTLPDVARAIERFTREIARVLGVDGMLLGENDKGSYALADSKTESFGMNVDAAVTEIAESAANRDVVGYVCGLNGISEELWPRYKPEQQQFKDSGQIAKTLALMASAGMPFTPTWEGVNELLDLMGLPPLPQDLAEQIAKDQKEANTASTAAPKAAPKKGDKKSGSKTTDKGG